MEVMERSYDSLEKEDERLTKHIFLLRLLDSLLTLYVTRKKGGKQIINSSESAFYIRTKNGVKWEIRRWNYTVRRLEMSWLNFLCIQLTFSSHCNVY